MHLRAKQVLGCRLFCAFRSTPCKNTPRWLASCSRSKTVLCQSSHTLELTLSLLGRYWPSLAAANGTHLHVPIDCFEDVACCFGLAINCVCLLYLVTAEICFATAALVVADVNREPCCPVVALQDLTHLCACYPLSGWHPRLAGATPPGPSARL